jgi:hypothetical protein
MLCPRCGTDNPVGAQFCTRCWSPMQQVAPPNPSQPGRPLDTSPRSAYETVSQTPAPDFGAMQQFPRPMTRPFVQSGRGASARAIVALVLGALSTFFWCPGISLAALLLGRMELNAIGRGESSPDSYTFARVGYILGIVFTVIHVGVVLLFVLVYGAAIVVWILAVLAMLLAGA